MPYSIIPVPSSLTINQISPISIGAFHSPDAGELFSSTIVVVCVVVIVIVTGGGVLVIVVVEVTGGWVFVIVVVIVEVIAGRVVVKVTVSFPPPHAENTGIVTSNPKIKNQDASFLFNMVIPL
jgi:hypothetical protein